MSVLKCVRSLRTGAVYSGPQKRHRINICCMNKWMNVNEWMKQWPSELCVGKDSELLFYSGEIMPLPICYDCHRHAIGEVTHIYWRSVIFISALCYKHKSLTLYSFIGKFDFVLCVDVINIKGIIRTLKWGWNQFV